MIQQISKTIIPFTIGTLILFGCGQKKSTTENLHFTKIDSLTDNYLSYNDSILQAWNLMVNDDNQKIKSMHHLLHELMITNEFNKEDLQILEERLNQLSENRYTFETFDSPLVEEYDFASNALVSEITTLAQQYSNFEQSESLQKIVDEVLAADQRVENYRSDYDMLVENYNQFIVSNTSTISGSENLDWKKKPKFSN